MTTPLRLDFCCLDNLEIKSRPNIDRQIDLKADFKHEMAVSLELGQSEKSNHKQVTVAFKFLWNDNLLSRFESINIQLTGWFTFARNLSDEMLSDIYPSLCIANLYGTARGIVGQATGICRGGVFWMPALNVKSLLKKMQYSTLKSTESESISSL